MDHNCTGTDLRRSTRERESFSAQVSLNRDEEGIGEIQQYIKLQPKDGYVETARKLVANPGRARENYAPDFSFTSSTGEAYPTYVIIDHEGILRFQRSKYGGYLDAAIRRQMKAAAQSAEAR